MKQLFRFSILVLALLLPATAVAHIFEVDGIYYNINGNEVSVTYKGSYESEDDNEYSGNVIIPATVTYKGTTFSVTSIDEYAFCDCSGLTSVTIPKSVISISEYAFYGCSGLTSVTIPNSVTSIGVCAFCGCSGLTSVTIPNSVTSIGGHAFTGTPWYDNQPDGLVYAGLVAYKYKGTMLAETQINLSNGTTGIAGYAFQDCSGLTSVTIPNSVITINDRAFERCRGLTSVVIPNSVTSIGRWAFKDCSGLTSVTIPNSVTFIDDGVFSYCSGLTNLTVESGNIVYDSPDNCNAIIETASNTLISGCKNTVIPNSVTSITRYAFQGCSGLTSVTIPNSVTSIGEYAFDGCSGLTSVTIPDSVTSISEGLFSGCDGLASVTIPNSITSIGRVAFLSCDGLTSVTIPNSVTSISDDAFYGCSGLTDVYCYIADISRVSSGNELFYLNGDDYSGRTLHVLQGTADAYQADENWYPYFGQIVDDLIPETPSGDVNGDGNVNISDVTTLIDYLLTGNANGVNLSAADCNKDNSINISDVTTLIDYLLTGTWPN